MDLRTEVLRIIKTEWEVQEFIRAIVRQEILPMAKKKEKYDIKETDEVFKEGDCVFQASEEFDDSYYIIVGRVDRITYEENDEGDEIQKVHVERRYTLDGEFGQIDFDDKFVPVELLAHDPETAYKKLIKFKGVEAD